MALGEPHQPALVADESLVDVVELLDQSVDARLLSRSDFTSAMISFLSFFYLRSCAGDSVSFFSLSWMS